jgi:hypothetical protein
VSLRFLAKVAFKKVAAHQNGKSMMNTHHKTHSEKHQHSKTAGFLNSTQANFHSKKLSFFWVPSLGWGWIFYFILANTSSVSGAKVSSVRNQRLYIYIF